MNANTKTKERPRGQIAKSPTSAGELTVSPQVVEFRQQMEKQKGQFEVVLPPGVDVDIFVRIVLTAVQSNQKLLNADRTSLMRAAQKAAQDGLLPDGREGAFVIYNDDEDEDGNPRNNGNKTPTVQWMPMIYGLNKKIRETGLVKEFRTRAVFEKDEFEVLFGDVEKITHKPHLGSARGKMIAAWAILETTDGGFEREVIVGEDIEKLRNASKAKKRGPWASWPEEMARKAVGRRLLKRVPLTPEVDQVLNRDTDHYDLNHIPASRQMLDAPAQPKRTDFFDEPRSRVAEDFADVGQQEPEIPDADEIEAMLRAAPNREELRAIWHKVQTEGFLVPLKDSGSKRHGSICELYNSLAEAFEQQNLVDSSASETGQEDAPRFAIDEDGHVLDNETGVVVPPKFVKHFDDGTFSVLKGYHDAAEKKVDVEPEEHAEEAGAGEEEEPDLDAITATQDALADLAKLATPRAINNWFDTSFMETVKRMKLTDAQVKVVTNQKNARVRALTK